MRGFFSPNVIASRTLIHHYGQIWLSFESLLHSLSAATQREKTHKPTMHFDSHLNLLDQQN